VVGAATTSEVASAAAASSARAADASPFTPKAIPSDRPSLRGDRLRAVIAGVLRFQDPRTPSFSDRHRKDAELAALLEQRGASGKVDLLLDDAATVRAIKTELRKTAEATAPDETLVFYYAGHGDRDKKGAIRFVGYDAEISLFDIETILRTSFKGQSVILLGDCCFSGGLEEVAAHLQKVGIHATALSSAEASNLSTAQWTFTQAVIDALEGAPLLDRDGDGFIELSELADETRATLAHFDHQRAGVALLGHAPGLILASATAPRPHGKLGAFEVGDFVDVPQAGKLTTGRIVATTVDHATVSIFDYADRTETDFAAADLHDVTFKRYPVGQVVQVEWEGKLWPAKIEATDGDFHFVSYPGWAAYWDEWVLSDRISP